MPDQLKLDNCNGAHIPNYRNEQGYVAGERLEAENYGKKYSDATAKPDSLTKTYNCHGLTFASRRTNITSGVESILTQDNYKQIDYGNVLAGDLVAYVSKGAFGAEVAHTGFALYKKGITLWVNSKWGAAAEFVHAVGDCPWGDHEIRYYRKT